MERTNMDAIVLNLENEKKGDLEIPIIFQTPIRPDLIKKAVLFQQSHRFQPQGRDIRAGKRTSAESWGTGRGMSRVPRQKGSSRAAFGVSIVGGHAAFPPKSEKIIRKEINKKERRLAIRSSIAASAKREVVAHRGHSVDTISQLPIIVDDEMQSLKKTREVKILFQKLGIWPDVERADRKKIRAGRGKTRGRKKKEGKGPLIVISEDLGIVKAAMNLPGVDIVNVRNLNAELLAPGAHPGRLVVWTESAFNALDEVWGGGNI
jgi:large subunit ribosomal protein L4e